jgi:enoyl-CoA hydratase/carnithine racemase
MVGSVTQYLYPSTSRYVTVLTLHGFLIESFLSDGLADERRAFYMLFASQDQKEGMKAYVEKRKAAWKGE